jgi:hypothetical protein
MKKILTLIGILLISTSASAAQKYEVGLGTNHGGVLGGSISTDLSENTEIFAGLGLTAGESVGFVIGSKLWLNDNIRLIGNYGYNCTVKTITIGSTTTTSYKDYMGLNIGAGYSFGGKESNGVSIDLMLIDTSDCNKASSTKSSSSLKLALGYSF